MKHRLPYHFSLQASLSFLLLAFLLASCGSTTASGTSNAGTTSTPPTSTTGSVLKSAYSTPNRLTKAAGLSIKLSSFVCTEGPFLSNLTIATDQLSYDAGSAQIIQNYLQLLTDNSNIQPQGTPYAGLVIWNPPAPPAALSWMPGSTKCTGELTLANTTHQDISIERFGFHLTAAPAINSNQYRRIPITSQCPGCGAGGACGYQVSVVLDGGTIGSNFDAPLTSTDGSQCPLPMTIPGVDAPSNSLELLVTLQDAQMRNILYTGMPQLTITGHSQPVTLPGLTSQLSFIQSDTLPCYQFQGNSFIPSHIQKLGCS